MRHQGPTDNCVACCAEEIAELRTELANVHHNAEMWYAEKLQAEAAIARVREMCAKARDRARRSQFSNALSVEDAMVWHKTILRALNGGTE